MAVAEPVVHPEKVTVVAHPRGREGDRALGREALGVGVQTRLLDDASGPRYHAVLEPLQVPVRVVVQDVAQRCSSRGHGQGVSVEGADLIVDPFRDQPHDLLGAADGPAWDPTA